MRKVFLLALVTLALLWLTAGCDNGVSNSSPYNYTQIVMEPTVDSYSQQVNGEITYNIFFPEWEKGLRQDLTDIGIQVDDGQIVKLGPATDRVGYRWSHTTVNGNIYVRIGRHKRFDPDSVDWANLNSIPSKWLRYYQGKPYIGLTLRDGQLNPIVQPPLTQLQAIIITTHEAATGDGIWFDGSTSTGNANPQSEIIIWDWNFGDGVVANGRAVNHAYQSPGNYKISLTVTDNYGNKNTAQTEVSVVELAAPGEIGNSYHRFHFDFFRNVVLSYYNFKKAAVTLLGSKPEVHGNFNGPEASWKLYYVGVGLQFDLFHDGWAYVEIPLTKSIIALKSGYSHWYDGSPENPDFSRSNFDHMKFGFHFNGRDFSDIIYSDGRVEQGP